jgi:hypothetical protein
MYGGQGIAGAGVGGGLASTGVGVAGGALPFTGFNVLWLILVAVTLVTTGIATVRLARR